MIKTKRLDIYSSLFRAYCLIDQKQEDLVWSQESTEDKKWALKVYQDKKLTLLDEITKVLAKK